MRVLFDIGHPAHVHYFKFLIKKIEANGGKVFVVAREKEVAHNLLRAYNIPFQSRGTGKNGILGKFFYLLSATKLMTQLARKFQPTIMVSFASPYAAKAAYNLKVPHIALDDTEHATFARKFYLKYTTKVVTPDSFNVQLGPKQMWFKGFMELCYLHPDVFQPNPHVLNWLHLKPNEKFILLRFVSFQASHDIGQHGMSFGFKTELIQLLEHKGYKVFISSEQEIPDELKKYKLTIPPEEMHHLLYFADGFIGEGATMASECAMLGTPAIYINSLNAGTLDTQEKMGLIRGFRNEKDVKQTVEDWLLTADRKAVCRSINAAFVKSFPAPTDTIYEILCKFTK